MIDLDQMADERARLLKQEAQEWKAIVWSAEFQKFSADLSDGEIEQILNWCPSVEHLRVLITYLNPLCQKESLTPYPLLLKIAKKEKINPEMWIKSKLSVNKSK